MLGKSVETIARAAKLLLQSGDVVVEARPGRSYRWAVLLEESDIRADPGRICLVRSAPEEKGAPVAVVKSERPVETPLELAPAPSAEPPRIPVRPEEESLSTATLLKRLMNIGMKRRVARELVKERDHTLIEAALTRVKGRSDIKNRAAYVLREVQDGGYEDLTEPTEPTVTNAPTPETPRIYSSAERTRAELEAIERERLAAQRSFQDVVKGLYERFDSLSESLKEPLKECCYCHLAALVPHTGRREMLLESQAFKKVAFKEVMERFFSLVDEGASPVQALAMVSTT